MKIKVGIFVFETDKTRMFLPVSTNDSFKIGNLNCGGLSNVLNQELMVWTDIEKSDILSLISDTPSDIKYVALGEILVSPMCSPNRYYYIMIMKNEKSGKEYLEIQPCVQIVPKLQTKPPKVKVECAKRSKKRISKLKPEPAVVKNSLEYILKEIDLRIDATKCWKKESIKYKRKN